MYMANKSVSQIANSQTDVLFNTQLCVYDMYIHTRIDLCVVFHSSEYSPLTYAWRTP
jgi:hypothetical protein